MKKILILATILFFLLWPSRNSFAQQISSAKESDSEQLLVKVDADLVSINVTPFDNNGDYLIQLRAEDFELWEDDTPRRIEFFQPVQKLEQYPIAVALALDISGSISSAEAEIQSQAIDQFINMLNKDSRCALIGFNNTISVWQDLTTDRKKLSRALRKKRDYGGSTRIYDALDRAITMLKKTPTTRGEKRLRRIIVVITDGFDSASIMDKRELVDRAQQAGVSIYSVTLPSYSPIIANGKKERLPTLLDIARITDFTGGHDFTVEDNNFSAVFAAITQEIAASYILAFHPNKEGSAGSFHKLEVRVKRPGVKLRVSRDGYYSNSK